MLKFTEREKDVIRLLLEGKTNREIANSLIISVHTVKAALEKIYEKTSCHNRIQLAIIILKKYNMNTNIF